MNKNKKRLLLFLGILIVTLSFIGISYAIWRLNLKGTYHNLVVSNCLKLTLEDEKNDISLEKAYPLYNEEGKKLTPYEFTITNTCDLFVSYNVNLEVLNETTLPIKYVSVLLNDEGVQRLSSFDTTNATLKDVSISKVLYKSGIGEGESQDYKLRLWLSEDVGPEDTDAMDKLFSSKVTIEASAGIYDPVSQGYDKLSDAILANEYQTTPEISKQKIAAKQAPDFTKTAPLITWSENKSLGLGSVSTVMPHPDLVALKDSDERYQNLTQENVLLPIDTGYTFDSETGKYTITNVQQLDPATLNYSGNTKYYFCGAGYTTSSTGVISFWKTSADCLTIYEILSASIIDSESTAIKTRKYNLKVYSLNQVERESDKSDKGLYSMEDDDGTSYYYRGSVSNNYVKFAGAYWRIIRINGDGSVRLLYAGTTSNATGNELVIESGNFNDLGNNPAYNGYMYGNTLNESYDKTTSNENDSDIKKILDSWYKTNIMGTNNESVVVDAGFCNDRSFYTGDGYSVVGNNTVYLSNQRYYQSKPSLKGSPRTSGKENCFNAP